MEGILGQKLGMTQIYAADGTVVPVTVIKAGPCLVVQRKTVATDGFIRDEHKVLEVLTGYLGTGYTATGTTQPLPSNPTLQELEMVRDVQSPPASG